MNSYEFTIVAGGLPIEGDEWHDIFYEAGCDDALLALQRGLFVLHFDREADSLEEAVTSACADVQSAGATIVRIEPDPLVSASDIADRTGITRQAVSLYVNGERGDGFPKPVACISGPRPLWKWSEVALWLHAAGKVETVVLEAAQLIDRLNAEGVEVNAPEATQDALVISEYARIEYYMRRPIENPTLRTQRSLLNERHRSGFNLRPNDRAARPAQRMVP